MHQAHTHQSINQENTPKDLTTGQSDKGNFLTEIPYSQSTLACIKLTKTNQNSLVNIREVRVKQLNIGEGGREGMGKEKEEGGEEEKDGERR